MSTSTIEVDCQGIRNKTIFKGRCMFYALIFYVPESHCEIVKTALFAKGAGKYQNYDCCSWQVLGHGQFRPLDGSAPYVGERGTIERISEYKVEMICDSSVLVAVLDELKNVHPYEEVAYHVYEVKTREDFPE